MLLMHIDSHGVKDRAGKILGAETGQDVDGYGRQEGQQFDFKPEWNKARVVQVFLRQSWRLLLKNLPKFWSHLTEVLQQKKVLLPSNPEAG